MELRGKYALVTGAASGIGRATAIALARAGARLFLSDVDEPGLAAVAGEVARHGPCEEAARVDVSSRDEVRALAERVHARVPALDVLVNNAGVGLAGGILDTSLDDWEWVLSINLWGVIHGCHYFTPPMVRRGAGHVVNVSSLLGFFGAPGTIGYVTSKFGVFGLSESLRAELEPRGVRVSVICPGMINTGIIAKTRFAGSDAPDGVRSRVQRAYQRRNYGPEKVADAIVTGIRRNRAVVPVTPEAWLAYVVKRFAPGLVSPLGRAMNRGVVRSSRDDKERTRA